MEHNKEKKVLVSVNDLIDVLSYESAFDLALNSYQVVSKNYNKMQWVKFLYDNWNDEISELLSDTSTIYGMLNVSKKMRIMQLISHIFDENFSLNQDFLDINLDEFISKSYQRALSSGFEISENMNLPIESLLTFADSHERVNLLFAFNQVRSNEEDFFKVFFNEWQSCDTNRNTKYDLNDVFENYNLGELFKQYGEGISKAVWNDLPSELIIYRASHKDGVDGYSWSLHLGEAYMFSQNMRYGNGDSNQVIHQAKISKEKIFFFNNREDEIFLKFKDIEVGSLKELDLSKIKKEYEKNRDKIENKADFDKIINVENFYKDNKKKKSSFGLK